MELTQGQGIVTLVRTRSAEQGDPSETHAVGPFATEDQLREWISAQKGSIEVESEMPLLAPDTYLETIASASA